MIENECQRLIMDCAFFSDRQEYESLAALFAEDGTKLKNSGRSYKV
jgi:hypothetical protein